MAYASMVADAKGNLFGTTTLGGGSADCASGCGTVFELAPQQDGSWSETVIHGFTAGSDGEAPQAPLIFDSAGNLYGTTSEGGGGNCDNVGLAGCGIVFEVLPVKSGHAWTEKVLYSFQGVPSGKGKGDATWPNGLVFGANGDLYGLAYEGGRCMTGETGTYCFGAGFPAEAVGRCVERERSLSLRRHDGFAGGPGSR